MDRQPTGNPPLVVVVRKKKDKPLSAEVPVPVPFKK